MGNWAGQKPKIHRKTMQEVGRLLTQCGLVFSTLGWATGQVVWPSAALALPPDDDRPEEVLRGEIMTAARSPIDGQPLTAAEYAELMARLGAEAEVDPLLPPQVRHVIFLLQLRQLVRTLTPRF